MEKHIVGFDSDISFEEYIGSSHNGLSFAIYTSMKISDEEKAALRID
ncbi:MAG: hypothetical protein K6E10_10270 [Eubacterium sp.]|nr:hypothetical protein [Eubacterium sp.]